MAGFVMQSLGCEVAAMNTVQFSMYCPTPEKDDS
jgi:pyridoxal/pyridoxine/pyridoxamine kinase